MGTAIFHSEYSAHYGVDNISLNFDARVSYSETYDIATNATTLRITNIELKNNTGLAWGSVPFFGSISINGTTLIDIDNETTVRTISLPADGAYHSISSMPTSGTTTITHNADGTGSFTMTLNSSYVQSSKYYFCGLYTYRPSELFYQLIPLGIQLPASQTVNLTTRPRASAVSATNANFGSAVSISITPAAQGTGFKHTVTTKCGGRTATVATKTSSTSLSWTPALATYGPLITNSKTASCTVTCKTYSGDTLIGTSTATCTLTFPSSCAPTISESDADVASTNYRTTYGRYIVGKSKVRVTLTPTFKYGATGAAAQITVNLVTYNFTTPNSSGKYATSSEEVLSSANNTSISYSVTDSRGFKTTGSATISLYSYTAPKINSFSVNRCNSDGTDNNTGVYLKVNYNVAITALGNNNSKTLKIYYKKTSEPTTWNSKTISMSAYTQSGADYSIPVDANSSYNVQLRVTDDFSTTTVALILSSAATHINHGTGVDGGIGIGKVCEFDKTLDMAADWKMRRGRILIEPFNLALGTEIPSSADLNNYTDPGTFICTSSSISQTLSNCPTTAAFKMIVSHIASSSRHYQILFANTTDIQIFARTYMSAGWGSWYRIGATAV